MRSYLSWLLPVVLVLSLLAAPAASASPTAAQPLSHAASPGQQKGVLPESDTGLYIIRLSGAALASYRGGLPGLVATSPEAAGERKIDLQSPEAQAYLEHLHKQQSQFLRSAAQKLGHEIRPAFQYLNVLNGLALEISREEAQALQGLPGVLAVYPDTLRHLETDVTPSFLEASKVWAGEIPGGTGGRGEGVIIGVIDTGINSRHPSFAEVDGDGYTHTNPYGSGVYKGWCATYAGFCNNKLIGAYGIYPAGTSPEDTEGHGSHTAGTAAGNRHQASFKVGATDFVRTIAGMAPRANIIAYKVCSPTCPSTAAIAAVNYAISNGVDVLNYSISGSDNPWNDVVDLAFLDASAAGIFIAASAGNSGPASSTVAKTGPWNASVGATTTRRIIANTLDVLTPPPPAALTGVAVMQGENNALTSDRTAAVSYNPANLTGCSSHPSGYFTSKIAMVQRGGCTFQVKVSNAASAGAAAVVVFDSAGGPPIVMGGLTGITTPAVFMTLEDGLLLKAYIDTHNPVTARINAPSAVVEKDAWADILAGFSSRGPSQFDILKPDYTAPGVNILAAVAAQGSDTARYSFLQGTSMAAPHAAGAAALLIGLHPTWTPAMVNSALAATAYDTGIRKEDGTTSAGRFDMGSGRINLALATAVGLVFDESYDNYVAANPDSGGDPRALNQPSLVNGSCANKCTWTRTVRSVAGSIATYNAVAEAPAGVTISVSPSSFTINPGGTQKLVFTANVTGKPQGVWIFGNVKLATNAYHPALHPGQPEAEAVRISEVHLPVAVRPAEGSFPARIKITTDQKAGEVEVSGFQIAEAVPDLTWQVSGLARAALHSAELPTDLTSQDPFNGDGTFFVTVAVPPDAVRLAAEVVLSEARDVDLYVGRGLTPSSGSVVCTSAAGLWNESCDIDNPASGTYWILVQNWEGSLSPPDLIKLAYGVVMPVPNSNLFPDGPTGVNAAEHFGVTLRWSEPSFEDGDYWYGALNLSNSANRIITVIPVDLSYNPQTSFLYYDLEGVIGKGEKVFLAGSFNDWDASAIEMEETEPGVFRATLPIMPGTYQYRYAAGDQNMDRLNRHNRSLALTGPAVIHDFRSVVPDTLRLLEPYQAAVRAGESTPDLSAEVGAGQLTGEAGQPGAVRMEIGYGPAGSPASWTTWAPMTWSRQVDGKDIFTAALTSWQPGAYSFAARFNANWGEGNPNSEWIYADRDGGVFELEKAGSLIVDKPAGMIFLPLAVRQ